jgi:hypothetical protein
VTAAVPGFVSVTVCEVLVVPTNWSANVRLVLEKLSAGAGVVDESSGLASLVTVF